jgi:hypothetical protein
MITPQELADAICRIDTLTEYQRELIAKAAAELRRLDALEQAAEPVGWMTESEDGKKMLWPTFAEALTYCDEDERPIPLYTHPARKPMTRDDMRKLTKEHFGSYDLTGADFSLIRAVERFHDIKE